MNPYTKYKTTTATTTNKISQLIFVFDEIIKSLHQGKKCMEANDTLGKINHFNKAIEIFQILKTGVDIESGKILELMAQFYDSTAMKIAKLNLENESIEEVEKVVTVISSVRDTISNLAKEEELE